MLIPFFVLLVVIFCPVFPGKMNGLDFMDNLFNMISKGSSYFIPKTTHEAEGYLGQPLEARLVMASDKQAEETALLFQAAGAEVSVSGAILLVSGDLGRIMTSCLEDAEHMFQNREQPLINRYGITAGTVMYNWWTATKGLIKDLNNQKKFKQAKSLATIQTKVIEPAYNYFGVETGNYKDNFVLIVSALAFYVFYTLWYGFGIMYLFEGFGLRVGH